MLGTEDPASDLSEEDTSKPVSKQDKKKKGKKAADTDSEEEVAKPAAATADTGSDDEGIPQPAKKDKKKKKGKTRVSNSEGSDDEGVAMPTKGPARASVDSEQGQQDSMSEDEKPAKAPQGKKWKKGAKKGTYGRYFTSKCVFPVSHAVAAFSTHPACAGKPEFLDEEEDLDALLQEVGLAPAAPEPKKADNAAAADDSDSDADEPGGTVCFSELVEEHIYVMLT